MAPKRSKSKSVGPPKTPNPGMETRLAERTRLAAEAAAAAAEAANDARRQAANDTISPITASPTGSPPARSLSPPPSTGRTPSEYEISSGYTGSPSGSPPLRTPSTLPSTGRTPPWDAISSGVPTASPHSSTRSIWSPSASPTDSELSVLSWRHSTVSPAGSPPRRSPSPVPSTGRTPPSPFSSSSSSFQSSNPATPPPNPHFVRPYRGGLSDTPPTMILGPFNNIPREAQNRSISRQLYLHGTLTNIRNTSSLSIPALFWLTYYRFILYPIRMYSRQVLLAWLFLAAWSVMYVSLNGESLREMPGQEVRALIQPLCAMYVYAIWLYLHIFDLYRGIEYLLNTPAGAFPGVYSDLSVRICALARPITRLVIAACVLLVLLEENMALNAWHGVAGEMAKATFTLAVVCACVDVAVYWIVGFFAERRRAIYAAGGAELGVFERWEVECVMPWGTGVAAFFALKYLALFVSVAWRRGWVFVPRGRDGVSWGGE